MPTERTKWQCVARGCDGCAVCDESIAAKEFVMVRTTMNAAMKEAMLAPRGYSNDGYPLAATSQERWSAVLAVARVTV